MTYTITATRWDEGWELDIEGVGVTQSASLMSAARMVRSYLAMDGHEDAGTADLVFRYEVDEESKREIAELRERLAAVEALKAEAAATSRRLVRRLKDRGLTGSDTAKVLGVSAQRISQLVRN